MYHKDREIFDKEIIKAILDMCEVINIGFSDGEYPYVLPVNFGYVFEGDLVFYTHHAVEGHKLSLAAKNPKVCVTTYKYAGHIQNDIDHTSHDYRSVMAFGEMSFVRRDSEEYKAGWDAMARQYGHKAPDIVFTPGYPVIMGKVVCRPGNVTGKSQIPIHDLTQVPLRG